MQLLSPAIQEQIRADYVLFAAIRERFRVPGAERGGCPQQHLTPVYVKKYGEHAGLFVGDVTNFHVQSSFSAAQHQRVSDTIVALTRLAHHQLSDLIYAAYQETRPYWLLALYRGFQHLLERLVAQHPELAPALEAIFYVAGAEGLRDIVRLTCQHTLAHALSGEATAPPTLLAFIDLHTRDDGSMFEVWCPGSDFTRSSVRHAERAAQRLVELGQATFAPPLEDEVRMLPSDLTSDIKHAIQRMIAPVLRACAISH